MLRLTLSSPSLGASILVGIAASVPAAMLAWLLNITFKLPVYFLTFFPAILVATWAGGRRSGFLSTFLSLPPIFYFLPPAREWTIHHTPGTWTAIGLFLAVAAVLVELAARVKTAVVTRDALLSMTSHDIKQPLGTVALEVEHLRRISRQTTPSAEEIGVHAARIGRQMNELNLMFMNLMDMVRTGSPGLLRPGTVNISEVIRGVVERFSVLLTSRNYQVTVEGADQPTVGVWDGFALERIFSNLLSNAAKYGEGRPIAISVKTSQEVVSISVRDHGAGMSPDDVQHCFEPFRRGSASRAVRGHGLGLWIVKMLVEAHRGTIQVESRPGEGTVFRVSLPRHPRRGAIVALREAFHSLTRTGSA